MNDIRAARRFADCLAGPWSGMLFTPDCDIDGVLPDFVPLEFGRLASP